MAGTASYAIAEGVATITLEDAAVRNAIDLTMARQLADGIVRAGREARALVIRGAGDFFCSGANVMTVMPSGGHDAPEAGRFMAEHFDPIVTGIRDSAIPVVTLLNGPAVGIGASIALMGDIILAVDTAYLRMAFRGVGLAADGGATYILPRMLSRARAMEMLVLGRKIDAARALDWGLINEVWSAEQLEAALAAVLGELVTGPASLGIVRRGVWEGLDQHWGAQLVAEARMQGEAVQTADFAEGVRAFREKRAPRFTGK